MKRGGPRTQTSGKRHVGGQGWQGARVRDRAKRGLPAVTQGEHRAQGPPGTVEGALVGETGQTRTEGFSGAPSANCARTWAAVTRHEHQ